MEIAVISYSLCKNIYLYAELIESPPLYSDLFSLFSKIDLSPLRNQLILSKRHIYGIQEDKSLRSLRILYLVSVSGHLEKLHETDNLL